MSPSGCFRLAPASLQKSYAIDFVNLDGVCTFDLFKVPDIKTAKTGPLQSRQKLTELFQLLAKQIVTATTYDIIVDLLLCQHQVDVANRASSLLASSVVCR
jgi:hypothetical protein